MRETSIPNVEEIFRLDDRIRYAQVVSSDGRILAGGMRKGLESLDPPEYRATRIQQFCANREMTEEWASKYGKFSYSILVFDNIKLFVFPLDETNTLFVSISSSIRRTTLERVLMDFINSSIV